MRTLLRVITLIILLIIFSICSLFYAAQNGYLNLQIKNCINYYFKNKEVNLNIQELDFSHNILNISKATINSTNFSSVLSNLTIKFNLNKLLNNHLIIINASSKQSIINFLDTKMQATAPIKTTINFNPFIQKITDLKIHASEILSTTKDNTTTGLINCKYTNDNTATSPINCEIKLAEDSGIFFEGTNLPHLKGSLKFNNIPLTIYKAFASYIDEEVYLYLNSHRLKGKITKGTLNINLDKGLLKNNHLTRENINAKIHISNLSLDYYPPYLPLVKTEGILILEGTESLFDIYKGYIGKNLVNQAKASLSIYGLDAPTLKIKGNLTGPLIDLISFIPAEELKKLKNNKIDLTKLSGCIKTDIDIVIPFAKHKPNVFFITGDITQASLKVFDDAAVFDNFSLKGSFDTKKITLEGLGKLNGLGSELYLSDDLTKQDVLLEIKTKITAKNQNYNGLKITNGNTIFNTQYHNIKGVEKITSQANLNDLEFSIPQISLKKFIGQQCNLLVTTNKPFPAQSFNFNLTGNNALKIIGNINLKNQEYKINLSTMEFDGTDVKGTIIYDKGLAIKVNLQGKQLNLKDLDLKQLSPTSTNNSFKEIKLNIDQVLLKNNITLAPFSLDLKAPGSGNYEILELSSQISGEEFTLQSKPLGNNKQALELNAKHVGKVLSGFGIKNKVISGSLRLLLIPDSNSTFNSPLHGITGGEFIFYNIVTHKTPILTKIITLASLSGIKNLLTNDSQIKFNKVEGNFTYKDEIITIPEGSAEGPYLSIIFKGDIDTKNHLYSFKGYVTPSFYGINSFIRNIPIVGKIFPGTNKEGILFAPFTIKDKF